MYRDIRMYLKQTRGKINLLIGGGRWWRENNREFKKLQLFNAGHNGSASLWPVPARPSRTYSTPFLMGIGGDGMGHIWAVKSSCGSFKHLNHQMHERVQRPIHN